jgi:hypothetical protein
LLRTVLRTSSMAKVEGTINEDMSIFLANVVRLFKNGRVCGFVEQSRKENPLLFSKLSYRPEPCHI